MLFKKLTLELEVKNCIACVGDLRAPRYTVSVSRVQPPAQSALSQTMKHVWTAERGLKYFGDASGQFSYRVSFWNSTLSGAILFCRGAALSIPENANHYDNEFYFR